jgi:hypothetical protein
MKSLNIFNLPRATIPNKAMAFTPNVREMSARKSASAAGD